MKRQIIVGLWTLTAFELLYLYSMTERVHRMEELLFGAMLIFATIALGGITVFGLRGD